MASYASMRPKLEPQNPCKAVDFQSAEAPRGECFRCVHPSHISTFSSCWPLRTASISSSSLSAPDRLPQWEDCGRRWGLPEGTQVKQPFGKRDKADTWLAYFPFAKCGPVFSLGQLLFFFNFLTSQNIGTEGHMAFEA